MNTIPDMELDLFTTTIDLAVRLANSGAAEAGYGELLYGLERAQAAEAEGEPWGGELSERWEAAVKRFEERWKVGKA